MLSIYYVVFMCLLVCFTKCEDDYLPPYIHPCDINSNKFTECIKEQIEKSLPEFTKGIPELGVPSTDPVQLDDIIIDGNGLKLKFTNASMHGLKNSKLSELKVNIGDANEKFTLAFKSNMSLTAKYDVKGQILILPILGHGDAVVKAKNVVVRIDSKLIHVKDAKGEHLKLTSPSYKYDMENAAFNLQNLFNGNIELAETTLKFANENWRQLMDDLAPPAIKQIVKTVVKAINKFFAHTTIQQLIEGYHSRP